MAEHSAPWWTRSPCAATVSQVSAPEAGPCRFRTLVSTECKVEVDSTGKPQRKCERIFRKFKDCPGRPVEVVERVEESTTEPNFKQEASPWNDLHSLRAHQEGSAQVISSEMGQLLEEVLAAFEKDFVLEGNSKQAQEWVSQFARNPDLNGSEEATTNDSGVFSRFFKKKPKCPSSKPGPASPDMYGEYADDFQEV